MKFNAFEGARRILHLTMGLVAVGGTIAAYNTSHTPSMTFEVTGPGRTPLYLNAQQHKWQKDCETDDRREFGYREFAPGKKVQIDICFRAVGEAGKKGIPFSLDAKDNTLWNVNEKYSPQVREYAERVEKQFTLSNVDKERAEKLWREERNDDYKTAAMWIFGSLGALWVLGAVIGWIVRGFAGIPMGKDARE